jgi:hypothetical protein
VVTGRCTGRGHGLTSASGQFIRSLRLGLVTGRWSGLTSVSGQFTCAQKQSARPARSVLHGTSVSDQASRGAESSEVVIGREARPVTYDRTRPVVKGAYWTQTGRWHYRVRSFARARPVVASRARGTERSARPVIATVTSDARCSRLSCSDRTRPVTLTGASGHPDLNCVIR